MRSEVVECRVDGARVQTSSGEEWRHRWCVDDATVINDKVALPPGEYRFTCAKCGDRINVRKVVEYSS